MRIRPYVDGIAQNAGLRAVDRNRQRPESGWAVSGVGVAVGVGEGVGVVVRSRVGIELG